MFDVPQRKHNQLLSVLQGLMGGVGALGQGLGRQRDRAQEERRYQDTLKERDYQHQENARNLAIGLVQHLAQNAGNPGAYNSVLGSLASGQNPTAPTPVQRPSLSIPNLTPGPAQTGALPGGGTATMPATPPRMDAVPNPSVRTSLSPWLLPQLQRAEAYAGGSAQDQARKEHLSDVEQGQNFQRELENLREKNRLAQAQELQKGRASIAEAHNRALGERDRNKFISDELDRYDKRGGSAQYRNDYLDGVIFPSWRAAHPYENADTMSSPVGATPTGGALPQGAITEEKMRQVILGVTNPNAKSVGPQPSDFYPDGTKVGSEINRNKAQAGLTQAKAADVVPAAEDRHTQAMTARQNAETRVQELVETRRYHDAVDRSKNADQRMRERIANNRLSFDQRKEAFAQALSGQKLVLERATKTGDSTLAAEKKAYAGKLLEQLNQLTLGMRQLKVSSAAGRIPSTQRQAVQDQLREFQRSYDAIQQAWKETVEGTNLALPNGANVAGGPQIAVPQPTVTVPGASGKSGNRANGRNYGFSNPQAPGLIESALRQKLVPDVATAVQRLRAQGYR